MIPNHYRVEQARAILLALLAVVLKLEAAKDRARSDEALTALAHPVKRERAAALAKGESHKKPSRRRKHRTSGSRRSARSPGRTRRSASR